MIKTFKSPAYNFIFNDQNGNFARWGKTFEDNPEFSPYGPEICDIELSTICHNHCSFCYKSNEEQGKNMSLETFKQVFAKLPKTVTQIAFGIGDLAQPIYLRKKKVETRIIDGETWEVISKNEYNKDPIFDYRQELELVNPDLWKITEYCRENRVVPNITVNGSRMKPEYYDKLANLCGAVAVSLYETNTCFDAVNELTRRGMKQVNIHALLAEETLDKCWEVLYGYGADGRLTKVNAIVFLKLKPKGFRNSFHQMDLEEYKRLITYAFDNMIPIGFDSCSAPKFTEVVKDRPDYKQLEMLIEPCESTLFSLYVNVDGDVYPCSFCEGIWPKINILTSENVWMEKTTQDFRERIIENVDTNGCRKCFVYNLD